MKKLLISLAVTALLVTGCTTPQVAETPPGSGNYSTNYITDPKLTAALTTIGAVNAATAPVNPYSPLVEIGLGAAALMASWFAKRKNDQAATSAALLKATVIGVEDAAHPETKKAIQESASRLGVEGELGTFVRSVNGGQL